MLGSPIRIRRGYHNPTHRIQTRSGLQAPAQDQMRQPNRQIYPNRHNIPRPVYQPGRPFVPTTMYRDHRSSLSTSRGSSLPILQNVQSIQQSRQSNFPSMSNAAPSTNASYELDPALFVIPDSTETNTIEINTRDTAQNEQKIVDFPFELFNDVSFSNLDNDFANLPPTTSG